MAEAATTTTTTTTTAFMEDAMETTLTPNHHLHLNTMIARSTTSSGDTPPPRPESLLRRTERAETQLARLRSQLQSLSASLFQEAERRVEEERSITAQWKQRALEAEHRAVMAEQHLARLASPTTHLPIPSRTSSILVTDPSPRQEEQEAPASDTDILLPMTEVEWDARSTNSFYSLASTERNWHRGESSSSVLFLPGLAEGTAEAEDGVSDACSFRTIDAVGSAGQSAEDLVGTEAEQGRSSRSNTSPLHEQDGLMRSSSSGSSSARPLSVILPWFARLRAAGADTDLDETEDAVEEQEMMSADSDSPMTPVAPEQSHAHRAASEPIIRISAPTHPDSQQQQAAPTTPRATHSELVVPPRGNSMSPVSFPADRNPHERSSSTPPSLDALSSTDLEDLDAQQAQAGPSSLPPMTDLPAYRPTLPGRLASLVYAPPPHDGADDEPMRSSTPSPAPSSLAPPPRSAQRPLSLSFSRDTETDTESALLHARRTSTSSSLSGDAHPPPPYRRILGSMDGVVLIPPRGARWAPSTSHHPHAAHPHPHAQNSNGTPAISLHHESLAPTRPTRSRPRTSDGLISRAAALLERTIEGGASGSGSGGGLSDRTTGASGMVGMGVEGELENGDGAMRSRAARDLRARALRDHHRRVGGVGAGLRGVAVSRVS